MKGGPLLVVFSGLPGTGKTTVARGVATRLGAVFLRIDVIEQAIRAGGAGPVGPAGYAVANAVAESNLVLGRAVVADCVNPVRASRVGWQAVAARAAARLVDIHLVCTDAAEHRRRVEGRRPDIPGHVLPTWDQVVRHEFEAWEEGVIRIDTAAMTPAEVIEACMGRVAREQGGG